MTDGTSGALRGLSNDRYLLFCLRLGAFLCLAGWTWVHFYWEGPYGALLWHDGTYDLAESLGVSWDEFVGTGANDGFVQIWIRRISWLYLICTILSLTVRKGTRFQMAGLVVGSGLLVVLSYAKYIAAQEQLPMFVEHGGQMLMPLLLVFGLSFGVRHRVTVTTAIVAFITTLVGHGCFAVGLWPTPPMFHAMSSVILGLEYETATVFLRTVGVLDFVCCVGLFIPRVRSASALYAATWGLLTALARPVAGMSWSLNYWGADQ